MLIFAIFALYGIALFVQVLRHVAINSEDLHLDYLVIGEVSKHKEGEPCKLDQEASEFECFEPDYQTHNPDAHRPSCIPKRTENA